MAFAYLVPLAGGDPIPIVKESVIVGRRPECDIRLEAVNVSGKHAELRLHRGRWHVIDLNSANGTKVNGDKVKKKRLAPGDEVVFARTNKFKLEFDPTAAANAAKPKVDAAAKDLAREGREEQDAWDKAAIRAKEALKKERADKRAKPPKQPVPAAADADDIDWLDVEEVKEHDFKKSLLEKAGLEKSSKPASDDEIDDDLEALEELEGIMDEGPTSPKKLDL